MIIFIIFRDSSISLLSEEPLGSFIIRFSETHVGFLVLSMRVPRSFHPDKVTHYFIEKFPNGYQIRGFSKLHQSLYSLITHHSVMQELLPVPLNISRSNCDQYNIDTDSEGIEGFLDIKLGGEAGSQ